MKCPRCGEQNLENAKYCQECGEFLENFYFRNIKWLLIIPLVIILYLVNIYDLNTFILVSIGGFFVSGYLIKRPVESVYNGLILGGISYFFSSLAIPHQYFTTTLAMQYTITGVIFGAVFGGFGGYAYKLIKND